MRTWMIASLSGFVVGSMITAGILYASHPSLVAAQPARPEAQARRAAVRAPGWAATAPDVRAPDGRDAPASAGDGAPERGVPASTVAAAPQGGGPPSYQHLLATTRTLQARIAQLERKASGSAPSPMTYDLSTADLQTMAAQCELRWDMPSLTLQPPMLPDDEVALLALSEAERATINRLFAASHKQLVDEVRQTYAGLTGDDSPGSMSPEAMYAEIVDKIPQAELQSIFQRIARERAGLTTPPAAGTSSPAEKMFRTLTSAGDRLEDELASALDPQLARSLRDMNGGWQSKFSSTHGCPR
jgi:hypothetical protein